MIQILIGIKPKQDRYWSKDDIIYRPILLIDFIYLTITPMISLIGFLFTFFCILKSISTLSSPRPTVKSVRLLIQYLMIYLFGNFIFILLHVFIFYSRYNFSLWNVKNSFPKEMVSYSMITLCIYMQILDMFFALDRLSHILSKKLCPFKNKRIRWLKFFITFLIIAFVNMVMLGSLTDKHNPAMSKRSQVSVGHCNENEFNNFKIGFLVNMILILLKYIFILIIQFVMYFNIILFR